jgi:hypothetical protein
MKTDSQASPTFPKYTPHFFRTPAECAKSYRDLADFHERLAKDDLAYAEKSAAAAKAGARTVTSGGYTFTLDAAQARASSMATAKGNRASARRNLAIAKRARRAAVKVESAASVAKWDRMMKKRADAHRRDELKAHARVAKAAKKTARKAAKKTAAKAPKKGKRAYAVKGPGMARHWCPECDKPFPIPWCPTHGSFYGKPHEQDTVSSKADGRGGRGPVPAPFKAGDMVEMPGRYGALCVDRMQRLPSGAWIVHARNADGATIAESAIKFRRSP